MKYGMESRRTPCAMGGRRGVTDLEMRAKRRSESADRPTVVGRGCKLEAMS
jgi:hypothetical protein